MKIKSYSKMFNLTLTVIVCLILTGQVTKADFEFGTPMKLGPAVNGVGQADSGVHIAPDGLSLYFYSSRPLGMSFDADIWVSTRPSRDDEWGPAESLGSPINSGVAELSPCLSADGLELYLAKGPVQQGDADIHVARRNSLSDPWGTPVNLGTQVNGTGPSFDVAPSVTADGLELYFNSNRSGRSVLYVCTRASTDDPWGPATKLGPPINTSFEVDGPGRGEIRPEVSPDGLTLFFGSTRPVPGRPFNNYYLSRRSSRESPWQTPVLLDTPPEPTLLGISFDQDMLYFSSDTPEGPMLETLWQMEIRPVVDFDGDMVVGIEDLILLIEHWGQADPVFDIGPAPLGDGFVGEADLEVLLANLGRNVDPTLVAHWKLDEVGGTIAYDHGSYDGQAEDATLFGDPVWAATEGALDGALALDGIDDYLGTPFLLDPGNGPFSVFAWIKGGAPDQVVVSQEDGRDWLLTDTQGYLMSDLASDGRRPGGPLVSDVIVTDDTWHWVGVTWDGATRTLYVDDFEAGHDTLSALKSSAGGLRIGTGQGRATNSFWAGMVDDVRVYSRAVTP